METSIYSNYCQDRLPCGVCKQTGDICPLGRTNLGHDWGLPIKYTSDTPRTDKGPSDYVYTTSTTPADIFSKTEVTNNG